MTATEGKWAVKREAKHGGSPVEEGLDGSLSLVQDLLRPEGSHVGLDAARSDGDEGQTGQEQRPPRVLPINA